MNLEFGEFPKDLREVTAKRFVSRRISYVVRYV